MNGIAPPKGVPTQTAPAPLRGQNRFLARLWRRVARRGGRGDGAPRALVATDGANVTLDGKDSCPRDQTFSVAMTQSISDTLEAHLLRADGQEDVIFALYQRSTGATRSTALIVDLVHPRDGERAVHRNASFTGDYFLRAAGMAADRDLGIALLHSHPKGRDWQGLSKDDREAESSHATAAQVITGLPLIGLTLGGADRKYSARRWVREDSAAPAAGTGVWRDQQAVSVRIVGEQIRVCFNDKVLPVPPGTPRTLRTVQSWGRFAHQDLIRLRIGVVGAGSVAQPVAESLVRTGFVHVDVIDFDLNEEHNLDRLLHATEDDIGFFKVDTLVEQLRRRAVTPGSAVHASTKSVVEPAGWLAALDCDVLFCCVDRPWPRYALNVAAYAHLVPVVDGGIAVDVTIPPPEDQVPVPDDPALLDLTPSVVRLAGAEWRAHLVAPGRKCMECLGQYDPGDVSIERAGLLDDPTYIATLPADHRLRRGENVFAFSLACAAAEVLELLRAVLGPAKIHDSGAILTHWTTATTDHDRTDCKPTCPFSTRLLAKGDATPLDVTGRHVAAEESRRRARRKSTIRPDLAPDSS